MNIAISNIIYSLNSTQLKIASFLVLAIITYPHVEYSRYPNKTLSPKEYTRKLGKVKCYHNIFDLVSESLEKLTENLLYLYSDK